jgi:hypothetical protein
MDCSGCPSCRRLHCGRLVGAIVWARDDLCLLVKHVHANVLIVPTEGIERRRRSMMFFININKWARSRLSPRQTRRSHASQLPMSEDSSFPSQPICCLHQSPVTYRASDVLHLHLQRAEGVLSSGGIKSDHDLCFPSSRRQPPSSGTRLPPLHDHLGIYCTTGVVCRHRSTASA